MIDRVNRAVLVLLGLALCAAGAVGIAIQQGGLYAEEPSVVYRTAKASVTSWPGLWWTVIIAGALLATILGLIYALSQLRVGGGRQLGTILLDRHPRGVTRLAPSAVSKAVARDLSRLTDVTGSRVLMRTFLPQPSLAIRLDVDDRANLEQVRARADEAFQRLCRALGADWVDVDLQVRLRPVTPARVE